MNIDMIRAAAGRIKGHARRTPILTSPFLDEIAGRRVFVKAECLQHTASFKFRGGWACPQAWGICGESKCDARGQAAAAATDHDIGLGYT